MPIPLVIEDGRQRRLENGEFCEFPDTTGLRWTDGVWYRYLTPDPLWKGENVYWQLPSGNGTLALTSQLPNPSGQPMVPNMFYASQTVGSSVPLFRAIDPRYDFGSYHDTTHISGFNFRTTATTIVIGSGRCIKEDGSVTVYPGGTISSSRASNTTYHLYAVSGSTVERVTNVPSAPYSGSARGRSGSAIRRYLGSVRTDSAGNYIPIITDFGSSQVRVYFGWNTGISGRVINDSGSAVAANVSCAAYVYGPTANTLSIRMFSTRAAGEIMRLYMWDGAAWALYINVASNGIAGSTQPMVLDVPCDDVPNLRHDSPSGVGGNWADLLGYTFAR